LTGRGDSGGFQDFILCQILREEEINKREKNSE
jgi:hypothetical protein